MEKAETVAAKKTQEKKAVEKKLMETVPAAEGKQSGTESAPAEKKPEVEAAPDLAVKSAVITGAKPDVKFYRISDDLPVYLL